MSALPLFALPAPADTVAAAAVDLVGGDVVLAVFGFAVLFVLFGLRPLIVHDGSSEGCGSCGGDVCGLGGCGAGSPESPDGEAS